MKEGTAAAICDTTYLDRGTGPPSAMNDRRWHAVEVGAEVLKEDCSVRCEVSIHKRI